MKRWLLLICACFAALAVRARQPGASFGLPCTVERDKFVVTVETVAGPRRFVFDTGASRTCISGALCRDLGLQAVGRDAMTDFEGHRSTVGRVTIPSLRLGEAVYDDLPVCVVPDSSYVFRCLGVDGIVGGDLLRKWVVRISGADSTIALAGSVRQFGSPDRRQSMRFGWSGLRPMLRLRASNGASRMSLFAIFDSGSGSYLDCRDFECRSMDERGILRDVHRTTGHSGNLGWTNRSTIREGVAAVIPALELAGCLLDGVPVETTCGNVGKLGLGILRWGEVIIDYPRRRFYLLPCDPAPGPPEVPLRNVTVALDGGRLVVGQVWDESLADTIAPGDRVVRLGTIDVSRVDPCAVVRGEIRGDKPEITVERADGAWVTIPIRNL